MKIYRTAIISVLVITISLPLFAAGVREEHPEAIITETEPEDDFFRIAFIYPGIPGVPGWSSEHDRARLAAVENLGDRIDTAYAENVPEGPDVARIMERYAKQGYNMIWSTSPGYAQQTKEVAEEYPGVIFEQYSSNKQTGNIGNYTGKIYQADYLSGIVAGAMTDTNIIGYVATAPAPEAIRGINAFALGVQKANPHATVRVEWIDTREARETDNKAVEALIDAGADIIARDRGVYYTAELIAEKLLVRAEWNLAEYIINRINTAANGEWKSESFSGGLDDGLVGLSDYSSLVPENVKLLVEAEKERIVSGSWDVFDGPVRDQSGSLVVAAGTTPTEKDLREMNWFVQGVVAADE